MWITFTVAAFLIVFALTIAVGNFHRTLRYRGLSPDTELSADKIDLFMLAG
jgi:hypothetical protein